MRKSSIIVGIVVVIAAVVIIAGYMGYIPGLANILPGANNDRPLTPMPGNEHHLSLSKFEVFSILEIIFNKDLVYVEIEPYIDALHMRVYGRSDMDAQTLLQWFEAQYASEGWSSEGTREQHTLTWSAYHEAWIRTSNARMVSIGEGAGVTQTFSYDTVYIVSYGPLTTYQQFMLAVI